MTKNQEVVIKPVFVKTKNVRHFETLMDGLALAAGEGRLGLVYGRAGRGKTRTAQWYSANNRSVYLRIFTAWSEVDFLRALCREVGVIDPPHRKGGCFSAITDRLVADPQPIFLDEIEKMPRRFLDIIRDISDVTAAAIVLIGEEELVSVMRQNRRVWSRTYQQAEFEPVSYTDIMLYMGESTGLMIDADAANIFYQDSGGDFRLIRRDMLDLVQYANAMGKAKIGGDDAKLIVKRTLKGK